MHLKGNLRKEFTMFELPAIFLLISRSNHYPFLAFLGSKRQIRKQTFFVAKIKTKQGQIE